MNFLSGLLVIVILNVTPPTGPHLILNTPPAPSNFRSTSDPVTCRAHEAYPQENICQALLVPGNMVLVWNWPGPASSSCPGPIDGFRIYRIDGGQHTLVDNVTTVYCDTAKNIWSVGTVGFDPEPRNGSCYDVVAVSGSKGESAPSNMFCLPRIKIQPLVTPH
jgi:hypothetical protein